MTERGPDTDVLLDYCCQLDVETDAKGPKINEKVADVVNKLCVRRVGQDQSREIMKRHNTPENVMVRLPKCEQSIWNQLPARTRVNDVKLSSQALLLSSVNCQLEVPNKLVESKASKEVLTSCLDEFKLAMTANFEWNQRRWEAIKPQFKTEFAKGLCTSTNPADEFLFGGDISKRVKEIAELTKSKVCKGPLSSRGRQRFAPYPARGYRGGLASEKGRSFRGRSSYSGNLSGQQQSFRNAPQPENSAVAKSHRNWYVPRTDLEVLVSDQRPFKAGQL